MTPIEIYDAVRRVIADTFSVPVDAISRSTVAEDVDGWDSLKHTILMVRIQNALKIRIPESVASEAASVGDLTDRLYEVVERAK
jgi:acyl carrier protein